MTDSQKVNSGFRTHSVENQSPLFGGFNSWRSNPLLHTMLAGISQPVVEDLDKHGAWAGQKETFELARLANANPPVLKTHDGQGNRIDQVEFHPAYHALMRRSVGAGMHNSIWDDDPTERGYRNLVRAAKYFISAGVEAGHLCPITMTNASVAAIIKSPAIARDWLPRIQSRKYDSTARAPGQKAGLTIGMA